MFMSQIEWESSRFNVRRKYTFIIIKTTPKCGLNLLSLLFLLSVLKSGDYFGETALSNGAYKNCYVAYGNVNILYLEQPQFESMLGHLRDALSSYMRMRLLQSVPLLCRLPEPKLSQLSDLMTRQSFSDGEYIIREGSEGDCFYIISDGEVKCTKSVKSTEDGKVQEEELMRLTTMEYFGERALLTKENRKANVIAIGPVECLVLSRDHFQILQAEVEQELKVEVKRRETLSGASTPTSPTSLEIKEIKTEIYFEDLITIRTLGVGSFGRVKLVKDEESGKTYALKCMNKIDIIATSQEENIFTEKKNLVECRHCPYIIQLVQTYNQTNQICMLMECIQGGELWSYIYDKKKLHLIPRSELGGFELDIARFYAANVVIAFEYMHGKNMAYRDLKPEVTIHSYKYYIYYILILLYFSCCKKNMLLDHRGYLKIIDFGFAKVLPYVRNNITIDKMYTLCGTPEYLAPEIILQKGYDKSVDLWALGCFIYELVNKVTPFQDSSTSAIFENIVESEQHLFFPDGTDAGVEFIVGKLLEVNPVFRLGNVKGGMRDIKKEPFFATIDWEALQRQELPTPYVPPIRGDLDCSNFDEYDEEDDVPPYDGDQDIFADF